MPQPGYKNTAPRDRGAPKPRRPKAQGIPFVFDATNIAEVERMAASGLNKGEISEILGISPQTMSKHVKLNAQLSDAITRGKAKAAYAVGRSLFKKACDGDVPAIKWWEQTRRGLSEVSEHRHVGADGGPIETVNTNVSMGLNRLEGESDEAYLARLREGTAQLLERRRAHEDALAGEP